MKSLVVTIAGTSSRFNTEIPKPTLKAIYSESEPKNTILFYILEMAKALKFDEVVLVGGFQYAELEEYLVQKIVKDLNLHLRCIFNPHFEDKGSAYSLFVGLEEIFSKNTKLPEEIVFMEGDLVVDLETLSKITNDPKDVITACHEPIVAKKSVAFYRRLDGRTQYIYDPKHESLHIPEKFLEIHNSGQIWKFRDTARLKSYQPGFSDEELKGTNLVFIQKYFDETPAPSVHYFEYWMNCNFATDYREGVRFMKEERSRWRK